jgi:hypothetical protein
MINLHTAIYALNSSVVTIRGDVAYDKDEKEVSYDKSSAETKLTELQAAEVFAEQATKDAKASALAKLTTLGLTQAEVTALLG